MSGVCPAHMVLCPTSPEQGPVMNQRGEKQLLYVEEEDLCVEGRTLEGTLSITVFQTKGHIFLISSISTGYW